MGEETYETWLSPGFSSQDSVNFQAVRKEGGEVSYLPLTKFSAKTSPNLDRYV
jgi:hypothetical protein